MELKPYQQEVINDLSLFLERVQETKDTAKAFHNFWSEHLKVPCNDLFSYGLEELPLEKENLMDCFE
jgi:hypothetical protein